MNHISCSIFGNILSEGFGSSSANVESSRVTSGIFDEFLSELEREAAER